MDNHICLVLNKYWKPISYCSIYTAISKMFNERALMITHPDFMTVNAEEWMAMQSDESSNSILTTKGYLPVPEVIMARYYERTDLRHPVCNRKNIIKRDGLICQYTGKSIPKNEATIDHILPRCRGGKTSWENCVVSSFSVNNKKGHHTPEEVNYILKNKPSKPSWGLVDFLPENFNMPDSWKAFLNEKRH
jgi:hypothetical protein